MHGWENLKAEDIELILAGIEQGRALGGPYHVELDPIDICNADCFFCNSAEIRNGAVFKWETLERRVDEWIAGGLRSFRIAGGGEPLIYPQLPQMLAKLREAGVVLDNITTNGIRFRDKNLEAILGLKVSNVMWSLNYSNETNYQRYMRTAGRKFTDIVENIRRYDAELRERGKRGETLFHLQFMLHRGVLPEMQEMMDLALDLPVDSVVFRACTLIPEDEMITDDESKRILRENVEKIADRSRGTIWLELDLEYIGMQPWANEVLSRIRTEGRENPGPGDDTVKPGSIEYCYIGWYSMLVQGTGDVHPCCFLLPKQQVPSFGNLNDSTVEQVWQGEMYRRHRAEMRTAMLMQERTPGQHRRFKCTMPFCWKHDECVLSHNLADRDFYLKAHERLERLRKRPLMQAARIGNVVSRRMIDRGRGMVKG